jgi:hypothetical protein
MSRNHCRGSENITILKLNRKGDENMTVSKNPTSLKLSMDIENGTNALGSMQTKSTSVGSVRLDADAAKCLAVAEAIGELMSHAVVNVYVTEKAELDEAERPQPVPCF